MNRTLRVLLALVVTGCLEESPSPAEGPPATREPVPADPYAQVQGPPTMQPQLLSFSGATSCADLEEDLEDRAALAMHLAMSQLRAAALGSWSNCSAAMPSGPGGSGGFSGGAGGGGGFLPWGPSSSCPPTSGMGDGGGTGAGGSAGASGSAGPADVTTTNVQVAGVDEADIVKNDGTRIFVLSGSTLYAATSWPPEALALTGQLALGGRPVEMFLEGTRLVVFSNASPGDANPNVTVVTFVDASDPSALQVTARQRIAGTYLTARRIGTTIHLVVNGTIQFADAQPTFLSPRDYSSPAELARAYDALAAQKEAAIRARTLEDWIPPITVETAGATRAVPVDCARAWVPTASAQLGMVSLVSFDLSDAASLTRSAVMAEAETVYANATSLYLSHPHWSWGPTTATVSYFYRFDLAAPAGPAYLAAGALQGHLLDQFSLDEAAGVLRLALTAWPEHFLVTMETRGDALVELGRGPAFGVGEVITGARFIGDTAYVVTFRQTDPLFTFDLADPAHPVLLGELQVPGYSTYLHPLDATHLLTVGLAPGASGWWTTQVALYDVSDRAHPRQTFTQQVGEWSWNAALQDHRAFNYFPARGLLALPLFDTTVSSTGVGQLTSDLRVFRVDPALGFTPLGALDMADLFQCPPGPGWCWDWSWRPGVQRSVMADDFVYAIGTGGIRVADVKALGVPLASAPFVSLVAVPRPTR